LINATQQRLGLSSCNVQNNKVAQSHARLFVFEADVQGEDVSIFDPLGHVGMPRAVIEDKTADKPCVRVRLVLHLHYLDHVQVDRFPFATRVCRTLSDGENSVDDVSGERDGETSMQFSGEGGVCYRNERSVVSIWLGNFERVEKLWIDNL
jgi:hypothetical protein